MRNLILFTAVLVTSMTLSNPAAFAQSGSRLSGFSGDGGGLGRRLSSAERQELAIQQAARQREQAQQLQKLQAEQAKVQHKQNLIQLGLSSNSSSNRRQNRLAFNEAKNDYKALRQGRVSPSQLGALQQPFRLDNKAINRQQHTAMWPDALLNPSLSPLVGKLDHKIMNMSVKDAMTAEEFLGDLAELNRSLNAAASGGEIGITEFARARRFVSGLANEIRVSDLVM